MADSNEDGLTKGHDGLLRCAWAGHDPLYQAYHDEEWGRPVGDDRQLFEKLCLEGFQAGLSWLTILKKRKAFREVFHGFEIGRVAAMGEDDVERLVGDARIIRHRGKITAAISNARATEALIAREGSLAAFLWAFEPEADERPDRVTLNWMRDNPVTPASVRLSKALRKEGFRFVGPTTCYAFMQSMGFVNDHMPGCHVRSATEADRYRFERPR
ncbi:probable dna-3-methyladenine glycosylase i protein [Fulvimarina pelagi HTCC2506]|uniref:Probable dna-3-methyladenine glycosylase i protein n=1 Tax=Fulvimarina pelagi HTCC2506 TaxID=314231 RepID=Q0G393_9HYPH|nr:DNA-3-methyladenine glycosylase I [Fulvimarina pelagi]EAU41938.1 probable dna-3-methyladenine glycosylase i protein [Fulvimarina pelagi HTCC2506]